MGKLDACDRAQTKSRRAGNFVWMKACIQKTSVTTKSDAMKYLVITRSPNSPETQYSATSISGGMGREKFELPPFPCYNFN